jgi:hypothetical protein
MAEDFLDGPGVIGLGVRGLSPQSSAGDNDGEQA